MLRHRINVAKRQAERIFPTGPIYPNFLNSIANTDWWHTQKPAGAVAPATNSALTAPDTKELLVKDFTAGLWELDGAGSIDDLDSFTSTGAGGMRANDPSFAAAKTYTARVKGTTTASGLAVKSFDNVTTYKTIVGGGVFDETFTFTGVSDGFYIRNDDAGTTNITWVDTTGKQTGILANSVYPGPELLDESGDGVMDKDNYTPQNGGTLTNPSIGILRVTRDGGDNPAARQVVTTIGRRFKQILQARSDGNATPIVTFLSTGQIEWTGTTTTDWQNVNFEQIAANTPIEYGAITSTGTEFVEFRLASVTEANPMNGDNNGMAIVSADGNLGLALEGDGATTYLDLTSAEFNSKLDPTDFHVLLWMQKDTWDTTERDILSFTVDANNWIRIVDTTTAGTLSFQFKAGGTLEEVTLVTGSPTTDVLVGLSVSGGVMKAWYQDEQTGSDQSVAGTFVGNFVTMLIGARTTDPTFVHLGRASHIGHATRELLVAEVFDIHQRGGVW